MMKHLKNPLLVAVLSFISLSASADQAKWIESHFPFQLRMNMETVYQVTHAHPSQLVATIQKQGVQILLVKDTTTSKTINSRLLGLKYASDELLKKAEFMPDYSGRMIPSTSPCCNLKQDLILIKDTAENYTLIHEYLHSLLKFNGHEPIGSIETDFRAVERKQLFYQRKLFEYAENLLNPVWRKDIITVQGEVVDLLSDRFRIGQVQEAIIEKILSRYIDKNNLNYDAKRQDEGLKYAEAMINNMITVYNNLDHSIKWNKDTTSNMREALAKGEIELVDKQKESLTQEEAEQFIKMNEEHLQKLESTKKEILDLKAFFTKP